MNLKFPMFYDCSAMWLLLLYMKKPYLISFFYSLVPDSIIIFKRTVSYKNLTAKLRKYVYKRLFYSMDNFGFCSFAKVIRFRVWVSQTIFKAVLDLFILNIYLLSLISTFSFHTNLEGWWDKSVYFFQKKFNVLKTVSTVNIFKSNNRRN